MSIDLSHVWQSVSRIIDTVVYLLPNLVLAILTLCAFLVVASLAKSIVQRSSRRRVRHQGLGLLLEHIVLAGITILGALIALSIVAPSFRAADLVKVLGIGSVAIGFA